MHLKFHPIEQLPDDVVVQNIIVRGGLEHSGGKSRPYLLHCVWQDTDGRFYVGRACEIEIEGPEEFAVVEIDGGADAWKREFLPRPA